jgi:hypothetical protein
MAIGLFFLMTADCCEWAFEPHPDAASGGIEAVDCDGNTAAEKSTWGRIKAMHK